MRLFNFFFLITCLSANLSFADTDFTHRKDVKKFMKTMAHEHGFKPQELSKVLAEVQLQPAIIEAMTKPYEKKPWDVYKAIFLTDQRIEEGFQFYKANQALLEKAEKKFGVSRDVIVAIIGVETLYGKHQGNYRVLDALATLAFNYPPRSAFFTKELGEYFMLCREHHISPTVYLGSYAGAMGKPQFMPSSYRHFATDFSQKSKKDLMNDNEAVIASVANYLSQHGWKNHEPVAEQANLQGLGYKRFNSDLKKAVYHPSQLRKAGIKPIAPVNHEPHKAGLIALNLSKGSEYWIAYPNFYVITRYNSSPQYALVVYLLAKELEKKRNEPAHLGL